MTGDDNNAMIAKLLADGAVAIDKPYEQPEPAEQTGARMTALGKRVREMQLANAEAIALPTSDEVKAEEATLVEPPPAPKTVTVFNVGNRYSIAPKGVKVKKVGNKFARRILRRRGGEGRIGRAVRESGAQFIDARRVTDSSHEARKLVDAQRKWVADGGKE